jgi:hypothetical protein
MSEALTDALIGAGAAVVVQVIAAVVGWPTPSMSTGKSHYLRPS